MKEGVEGEISNSYSAGIDCDGGRGKMIMIAIVFVSFVVVG